MNVVSVKSSGLVAIQVEDNPTRWLVFNGAMQVGVIKVTGAYDGELDGLHSLNTTKLRQAANLIVKVARESRLMGVQW